MVELRAGFRVTGVSYQRLRNHSTMLRLVMTQVRADGSRPVVIGMTRSTRTLRSIQGASQSLARVVLQAAHEVVHNLADNLTSRFQGLARNRSTQRDEIRHKMNISLQRRKKFRLQHQRLQIQPLECIFLDDLHDRSREEFANVSKPFCDPRRRRAESASALLPAAIVQ